MPLHKYANEAGFSVQTDGFYDAMQQPEDKNVADFWSHYYVTPLHVFTPDFANH